MHESSRASAEPRFPMGLGMLGSGRALPARQASERAGRSEEVFCEDCGSQRIENGGPRCHHCERELGGECGP